MISIRIASPDLPTGYTHESTDWQISDSNNFNNIIAESLGDVDFKLNKVFNIEPDPAVTYYARARLLYNSGFSEWSVIQVFNVNDTKDIYLVTDIPAVIEPPKLTITGDVENMTFNNISVVSEPMNSLDTVTHVSTTWVLEDMFGQHIASSHDDVTNLLSYTFTLLENLPDNTLFRIRAFFKGSNNDVSNAGTATFITRSV